MRTSRPSICSTSPSASLSTAARLQQAAMDTKQDVLDMLTELAELTMLDEGNPNSFRTRAYESAAQAIAAQATDLGRLTIKELQRIEGIGKSTADKIRELLETGRVQKLETLREKHP